MRVLILSPEAPYPLDGGGAYRIASLLHYFSRFADVDLILINETGEPSPIPPGLVRSQQVIRLPHHNRGSVARYKRNARRAIRGVPPLIDRFSGLEAEIERLVDGGRYDLGLVEHFWCAPCISKISNCCEKVWLDLHNIESVLHRRCAAPGFNSGGQNALTRALIKAGHYRFASASRRLEAALLPQYSAVLTTSEPDADAVRRIAPGAGVHVYPNALPLRDFGAVPEQLHIVFSGNFEYHPNIDAVQFLVGEIWPRIRKVRPDLRLRLVGRGDSFIRHLLPDGPTGETGIEVTGPVSDAQIEIAQACVVVAPLRAGSGTRIKILEAWAAARPVVATPLAAEGLDARDGENIVLASDPEQFAAAVLDLSVKSNTRFLIGSVSKSTFRQLYSWEIAWKKLDVALQVPQHTALSGYTGEI